MLIERLIQRRDKIISEIENAGLPVFALGDFPIIISTNDATLNVVFGDSGVGKTLLNQCLMHSLLQSDDDIVVFWADLEYVANISNEREVHDFLKRYDNFHLVKIDEDAINDFYDMVKANGMKYREFTNARYIYFLAKEAVERYPDKRIIFVVDSLEDMIEDTNDDKEVKRIFSEILRLKRTTFIFSHHINKREIGSSLKFRGSMVIKAKLSSLLYIEKKEDINDFEAEYSIEIVKLRSMWNGNRKIIVSIDKTNLRVKDINKNTDSFERKVIRSAYFLLRKADKMKKTELIEAISRQIKVNKQSVRNIIEKNNDLFNITVGMHNTQIYSLNVDKIDELLVLAGLDNDLSDIKKELIRVVDELIEAGKDNTNIVISSNGSVIEFKKLSTIKNSIYKLSDYEANCILERLINQNNSDDDSVEF